MQESQKNLYNNFIFLYRQTNMADYFDELGWTPVSPENTQDHQLMLMVRFLQQNGFFSDEFHSERLPPPASKKVIEDLQEKQVGKDDEKCSICLKPNEEENETFKVLPCKHDFHKSCIIPWLQKVRNSYISKLYTYYKYYIF